MPVNSVPVGSVASGVSELPVEHWRNTGRQREAGIRHGPHGTRHGTFSAYSLSGYGASGCVHKTAKTTPKLPFPITRRTLKCVASFMKVKRSLVSRSSTGASGTGVTTSGRLQLVCSGAMDIFRRVSRIANGGITDPNPT
jgi:hypothetical protein